jgi:hypothetical protein
MNIDGHNNISLELNAYDVAVLGEAMLCYAQTLARQNMPTGDAMKIMVLQSISEKVIALQSISERIAELPELKIKQKKVEEELMQALICEKEVQGEDNEHE